MSGIRLEANPRRGESEMKRFRPWLVLALVAAAGCEGAEQFPEEEAAVEGESGAFEGLSRDELRSRAEPMSPAVAESLGIIDTTIHVEDPSPDTVLPQPPTTPPTDTIRG